MRVRDRLFPALLSVSLAAPFTGCAAGPVEKADPDVEGAPEAPAAPTAADLAFEQLTGRFDSSQQAATNPAYFAVQLHTCVIEVPELGERVLYVEQAMAQSLNAPYRQRLYVVRDDETAGAVTSAVYTLVSPERFVGLCRGDEGAALPTALDAEPRSGCDVHLNQVDELFVGATTGKTCESTLSGASYATSEVTMSATEIRSWDRGYDASDKQVWGAVAGPYIFNRLE
ncbi:MAG: chromophore lyase CpcT/CpeT [Myxococcota bacterium]